MPIHDTSERIRKSRAVTATLLLSIGTYRSILQTTTGPQSWDFGATRVYLDAWYLHSFHPRTEWARKLSRMD